MLDLEHLLHARQRGAGRSGRSQAAHRVLPVDPHHAVDPGVPLLHPVPALADLRRPVRDKRQQPGRGGRDDPERVVPGAPRQDDQVHDPAHGPLPGLPARVSDRVLRASQEPDEQVSLHVMRQPARELSDDAIHGDEDAVLRQRHRTAVPAERVPRNRLPSVRHRCDSRSSDGQRLVGDSRLPAGDTLRLQDTSDGHGAAAHGAMRPPDQSIQREDIHLSVVLDGVSRGHHLPQLPALGLGVVLQVDPRALHPEAPVDHGQTEPGRRPRREAVVELHGALSAPGRHLRVEARSEELDGARRRRYRIGAVGQLPEQTDECEDFRR